MHCLTLFDQLDLEAGKLMACLIADARMCTIGPRVLSLDETAFAMAVLRMSS